MPFSPNPTGGGGGGASFSAAAGGGSFGVGISGGRIFASGSLSGFSFNTSGKQFSVSTRIPLSIGGKNFGSLAVSLGSGGFSVGGISLSF